MCDPVTMASTASMINSIGMATGINTLGAASAVGSLSGGASAGFFSLTNAMGAVRNIGTIASAIGNNPITGLGMSLMSANAERTRAGYEAAQARYQQQQYKEEIERQRLEQIQQENERKRRFAREFSSNQAIAAASGVDIASASYQALFASNRETYLKDRDAISMNSLDEIVRSRQNLQLAKAKEQQAIKTGKTNVAVKVAEGLLRTKQIYDEM
jgi:hypothetical protein